MNTNRVARSSTSFFQQMMDTDLKRKSLIVAVALTALGLVAIMASCYRRMSAQKQIKKLEKNDKQQTRPINEKVPAKSNSEKTSIGQQTNQTGMKSEAHSSPKSGPENQYSSPKLSDAFLSPQLQHQAQVIKQNNPKPVQQHSMPHPQDPRKFI